MSKIDDLENENPKELIRIASDYASCLNFQKAIKYYLKAADYHDCEAFYALGYIYLGGWGVRKNISKAREYLLEAGDEPYSLNLLGVLYSDKKSAFFDPNLALEYFEKSANMGNPYAMLNASEAYLSGKHYAVNLEKGLLYLLETIDVWGEKTEDNDMHFYPTDWQMEANEKLFELEETDAFLTALKSIAERNNRVAQYYMYSFCNQKEKINWLIQSADNGFPIAQYELGVNYNASLGGVTEKNNQKAKKYLSAAAEQGYSGTIFFVRAYERKDILDLNKKANVQNRIGLMYEYGEWDYEKAVIWYKRAANNGVYEAQLKLAKIFYEGSWIPQNLNEAYKWFRVTAKKGNAKSQFFVGLFYYIGKVIKKNDIKAEEWWRMAADQNYIVAQYCINCALKDPYADDNENQTLDCIKRNLDYKTFLLFYEMYDYCRNKYKEKMVIVEQGQNHLYTIKNVQAVSAFTLNRKWRHTMQVITTDNGIFIDNNLRNGGHDWSKDVGKTIKARYKHFWGYDWLICIDNNQKQKAEISRKPVELNKTIIDSFLATRSLSPVNGDCNLIKQGGVSVLASESGMRNKALSWAGVEIKINVYEKDGERLIDWEWESNS